MSSPPLATDDPVDTDDRRATRLDRVDANRDDDIRRAEESPSDEDPVELAVEELEADAPRRGGWLARLSGPIAFFASLAIAGVVLWWSGAVDDAGPAIRRADPWAIALGLVLYVVGLGLLCLRWHVMVKMTKGASDLARASEVFLISVALNYVAPLKMAIPMRAALTKRALGLDVTETGAVVFWEIVVDVCILGLGSLIWLLTTRDAYDDVLEEVAGSLLLVGAAVLVGLLGLGAALLVLRRRPSLRQKLLDSLVRALRYPRARPVEAAQAFGLTLVYWVVQAAVIWIFLDALGEAVTAGLALGMTTLPILIGMFSPGPGGAGVREVVMAIVAGAHGGSTDNAIVAAVAYRVALFAAIPILYLLAKGWIAVRRDGG